MDGRISPAKVRYIIGRLFPSQFKESPHLGLWCGLLYGERDATGRDGNEIEGFFCDVYNNSATEGVCSDWCETVSIGAVPFF